MSSQPISTLDKWTCRDSDNTTTDNHSTPQPMQANALVESVDSSSTTFAGRQNFPKGKSKPDHRTPIDLFDNISRIVGGFDLDACASHENHLVKFYFTEEDNSLKHDWHGKIWCNPPYSHWGDFAEKAVQECFKGNAQEVWLLIPARTDTRAFHQWIWGHGVELRFFKGRLNFTGPHALKGNKPSAPFPSVLVKFNKNSGKVPARVISVDRQGNELHPIGMGAFL